MLICVQEYNLILQSNDLENGESKIIDNSVIRSKQMTMRLGNKLEVIMVVDDI